MNRPDLYDPDDRELIRARTGAEQGFAGGVANIASDDGRRRLVALTARSIIHGFISLWVSGALREYGDDAEEVAFLLGVGLADLGQAAHQLISELQVSSMPEYRSRLAQAPEDN